MDSMLEFKLLDTSAAARRLGVPARWLRAEAQAGRVPCLRAGTRFLFYIPTVERLLHKAARNGRPESTEAPHGAP